MDTTYRWLFGGPTDDCPFSVSPEVLLQLEIVLIRTSYSYVRRRIRRHCAPPVYSLWTMKNLSQWQCGKSTADSTSGITRYLSSANRSLRPTFPFNIWSPYISFAVQGSSRLRRWWWYINQNNCATQVTITFTSLYPARLFTLTTPQACLLLILLLISIPVMP